MPDFDSSEPGVEYSRVMSLSVDYSAPLTAQVRVVLQPHVMLKNWEHRATGPSSNMQFNVIPADFAETNPEKGTVERTIPLRDVSTGVLLGASISMRHLFVGVASLIREQELALLAPAPAPASDPTPEQAPE